jgi:hypothetical protein
MGEVVGVLEGEAAEVGFGSCAALVFGWNGVAFTESGDNLLAMLPARFGDTQTIKLLAGCSSWGRFYESVSDVIYRIKTLKGAIKKYKYCVFVAFTLCHTIGDFGP